MWHRAGGSGFPISPVRLFPPTDACELSDADPEKNYKIAEVPPARLQLSPLVQ